MWEQMKKCLIEKRQSITTWLILICFSCQAKLIISQTDNVHKDQAILYYSHYGEYRKKTPSSKVAVTSLKKMLLSDIHLWITLSCCEFRNNHLGLKQTMFINSSFYNLLVSTEGHIFIMMNDPVVGFQLASFYRSFFLAVVMLFPHGRAKTNGNHHTWISNGLKYIKRIRALLS